MTYQLGIDPGTTFTATAVHREARVEIVALGDHAAAIPSVVLLKDDGSFLIGDAASRRSLTEPQRGASQFKRRIGDSTPLMLGGVPHSAEALMAKVLRWTVDRVSEVEGGPPSNITVTHPANWGAFKIDRLEQAIRLADLTGAATLTEPEAAAIFYASAERVEAGSVVGVYDLGGGTFDAAVLRKTLDGWEILGQPEGIEQLGGVDFDEAVLEHVKRSVPGAFDDLDLGDVATLAALARVRRDCVDAKEALSSDTEVSIPVLLPKVNLEVRLTRPELEAMIRPTLQETVGAMERALRSAQVDASDVTAVLLVGGSSRIPLVAELVGAAFGRPVAVDAHPKHAVALGAALDAAHRSGSAATVEVDPGTEVALTAVEPSESRPPRIAGHRRRAVLVAAGAIALAVGAAVWGITTLGDETGGTTTTLAIAGDPELELARRVEVSEFPDGIAFDAQGALWVASTSGAELTRVDPDSEESSIVSFPAGSDPLAVAITDDGSVWVTLRNAAQVARVDPGLLEITDTVDVGPRPVALAVGDGSLWVAVDDGIERMDPASGDVTAKIELSSPRGIVVTDAATWVTLLSGELVRIDHDSNEVVDTIDVGGEPDGIAVDDEGILWVTQRAEGTLARVDPEAGDVTDVIDIGTNPADLVVADGFAWVTDNGDGTLVLVDLAQPDVVAEIEVGTRPLDLAVEQGTAWVSVTGEDVIVEIALSQGP